ncbi:sugar phosphate exchanger 3 isoform X2 [Lingula anatina]|uniref:Sugar phosphate exchanger 3 isoform X2 n=1 Tax=Lingula anatina TaxID=7574 RepID=A0A1S3IA27_LINAN|nr:sugar phosphate exchanger 3 isoform X2 [Lingula anatina]|eukprot:XP_013395115.1 sugar phosphate exchanger 3 isoform X2 [Lingula anatina]
MDGYCTSLAICSNADVFRITWGSFWCKKDFCFIAYSFRIVYDLSGAVEFIPHIYSSFIHKWNSTVSVLAIMFQDHRSLVLRQYQKHCVWDIWNISLCWRNRWDFFGSISPISVFLEVCVFLAICYIAASSTRMKNGTNPTFLQLWQIPMVPEISVGMFCLKLVRYCMYMWLPMYLLQHLSYAKTMAGMFSTMFEIGGVAGSAFIGFILDRCFQGRSLLGTALSMLLSTAALLMFAGTSSWGYLFNSLFMVLAGAFNCGPDSILGGAIGAELGEMDGRNAAAAVTGIINGFGSVGAFIEGPLIGLVSGYYGWSGMFYLMVLLSLCGTLSVFRAAIVYSRQKSGARLESDLKLISVV